MLSKVKMLSKHFNERELACKCCGKSKVDPRLVGGLELLRGMVSSHLGRDTPLVINSGYRCPKHNKAVGGAADSQHLKGTAADVRVPAGMTAANFAELASHVDVFRSGGIGTYVDQGFVHVDVRKGKARWNG